MKVVHCRHGEFDVYIGRPMPDFPDGSPFANPFKIGRDGTRAGVLAKYEQYLRNSPELMDKILELDGKVLGCWCKPAKCHGDIIVKIIEEIKHDKKYFIF